MDDADEPDEALTQSLMYVHSQLAHRSMEITRLAAHVEALTELLIANGMVSVRELTRKRDAVESTMLEQRLEQWDGAMATLDPRDKYEVSGPEINCADRLHLCKASCCRLHFYLSEQDLREHVVRWEISQPYMIRRREDGYCTHNDETTKGCTIHGQRPLVCRSYDCRQDKRIWEDFDAMIPNPTLP